MSRSSEYSSGRVERNSYGGGSSFSILLYKAARGLKRAFFSTVAIEAASFFSSSFGSSSSFASSTVFGFGISGATPLSPTARKNQLFPSLKDWMAIL